ncbi:MAG: hypothetical protein ACLFU8_03845 [Anaerolineales bacterium]
MSKRRNTLIILLVLQFIALILYTPDFFRAAPQAIIIPPTLLILMILGVAGIITGTLSPALGRSLLIFVQGVNIAVRLMMFFPNLKTGETWDIGLIILQLVSMGISWYTMMQMEKRRVDTLRLVPSREDSSG